MRTAYVALFFDRKRVVIGCLLAAISVVCVRGGAQEYSFRNFVGADGLGNLSIQKIYQDHTGFLWVGTENGIFRYDGDRFESFGPAQGVPAVRAVDFGEAADGSLLVGASTGLYRLKGKRFEKVAAPFKTVNSTQGIRSDTKGHTYLGTDLGLFEMTLPAGEKGIVLRRLYPIQDAPAVNAHGVFVDGDAVWFGCGVKLCHMQGGDVKVYGKEDGLLDVALVAVLKDHDGNVWVRARNEGVLEWPVGEMKFRRPDTPVPGRALTGTPGLDRDGRVLLGMSDGLLIKDVAGWRVIDRRVGLRGGIYAAFEDRQHSLWMGTGGRGLVQWRGYREWTSYSSVSGMPSDNVYEMLPQADGSIWVGTESGLVRGVSQGFGMKWTTVAGTSGLAVHSLQMDAAGDLWIGTVSKGVGRLHARSGQMEWRTDKQGLPSRVAFTIRFDHKQRLWAVTEAGLYMAAAPYTQFTRVGELPASWFWTVTEGSDGTIWAGGVDGLFALTAGGWQHWDKAKGLTNQSVTAIGADRNGAVWVGYEHGGGIDRVRIAPGGLSIEKDVQRPGSDGLIYFLNFDRAGRLWAGTERGVDVWDGVHWSHYDTSDGLVWEDCDLGGFAEGPDGAVWIGTSGGLSRFKAREATNATLPLRVVFTNLQYGKADVLGEQDRKFAMSSGELIARFAAPDALQDSSLLFRYRVEGGQSVWTETTQRLVEFANLAPGEYELEVQARGRDGMWSTQAARFAFSIRAPWYRRGWFLALLMMLPMLGAGIVYRIRLRGARLRELRLQRIVDKRTRDLREANEELLQLTMVDGLTGVANRRHFDQWLAQECARSTRSGSALSLLLVDVDHFKALNDSAGHQKGDEYLVVLGRELERVARRRVDLAARFGGEEFVLVLAETNAEEAGRIAEALRAGVEALGLPHPASGVAKWLTVSVGVATSVAGKECSPEELVSAADQALYRAKSLGRNRVVVG